MSTTTRLVSLSLVSVLSVRGTKLACYDMSYQFLQLQIGTSCHIFDHRPHGTKQVRKVNLEKPEKPLGLLSGIPEHNTFLLALTLTVSKLSNSEDEACDLDPKLT